MTTLMDRALHLLELAGNSTKELARIAGVKPPSVSQWVSGQTKSIQIEPATRMGKHFGLNPLWISKGVLPKHSGEEVQQVSPGDNRLPIKRVLFKLAAGVSGYEVEYENGESEPIFMAKRWFDQNGYKPGKMLAVRVTGRSMEPRLYDGDLVVINTDDTRLVDGEPYAANYEGELVIKRLKRDGGNWYLSSDNPDKARYSDKLCADGCGIIGRIVYRQTEHI